MVSNVAMRFKLWVPQDLILPLFVWERAVQYTRTSNIVHCFSVYVCVCVCVCVRVCLVDNKMLKLMKGKGEEEEEKEEVSRKMMQLARQVVMDVGEL